MKLYEVTYYLGGHLELRPGKIARADLHLEVHGRHHGVRVILERARPRDCLSRSGGVFLADSQHSIRLLGILENHIYAAQPFGNIWHSDLNWWHMIHHTSTHAEPERAQHIAELPTYVTHLP